MQEEQIDGKELVRLVPIYSRVVGRLVEGTKACFYKPAAEIMECDVYLYAEGTLPPFELTDEEVKALWIFAALVNTVLTTAKRKDLLS